MISEQEAKNLLRKKLALSASSESENMMDNTAEAGVEEPKPMTKDEIIARIEEIDAERASLEEQLKTMG